MSSSDRERANVCPGVMDVGGGARKSKFIGRKAFCGGRKGPRNYHMSIVKFTEVRKLPHGFALFDISYEQKQLSTLSTGGETSTNDYLNGTRREDRERPKHLPAASAKPVQIAQTGSVDFTD